MWPSDATHVAIARRQEVFCGGDDQHCYDDEQFLISSGGACLEELTDWWECLGTSAIYEDCSDDCRPGPSLDCQLAYCEDNESAPECSCDSPGGVPCPPTPQPG